MSGASAISIRGLRVAYGTTQAVRSIDLSLLEGEAICIIGSNGAGKTSMLRGIMGLVEASFDELAYFGTSLRGVPTHAFAAKGIGYVPEGRELFPNLTIEEELLIGGRRLTKPDCARRLSEMFTMFPRLAERRAQITRTLSGGEQQMVAIARTLMGGPRLLMLDEPSLGLAPVIQDVVYDALKVLRANGLSILLVEQNAFRALDLCDRGYVLEHGLFVRSGPSAELLADSDIKHAYLGS